MNPQTTLVLGASENPERYSYKAVVLLHQKQFPVYALGFKAGSINQTPIHTEWPESGTIHTLSLYLNPSRQAEWIEHILRLKPNRIIFNPGTENDILEEKATAAGIQCLEACTLVLLHTGQF
jgi:hypothetical protein